MICRFLALLFPVILISAGAAAERPTAYVINSTGESLSKIDLETGVVTNDILPLGSDVDCYPNQIVVRDTLAYVLNSGTDEIQIIDLNSENTVGWISFDPGSNPYWMAFRNEHYMYVTLLNVDKLAKVDLTTSQVVLTTEVGKSPEGILIYNNMAFIALTAYEFSTWSWGQGKVVIYDTDNDLLTGQEFLTATNPQFLDVDSRGIIHCVCTGNYWDVFGVVYLIDPELNSLVETVEIGGTPGHIAIAPDDRAWIAAGGWVSGGEVYAYNAQSLEIYHDAAEPLGVDSGAISVAAFQDSSVFVLTFADIISRHDDSGGLTAIYELGDGPSHLDFDYRPGDTNGDWQVNVGDAIYLINFIFHSGPRPRFPAWRSDINADGNINIGDVVYLIGYIFKQSDRPRLGMTWIR